MRIQPSAAVQRALIVLTTVSLLIVCLGSGCNGSTENDAASLRSEHERARPIIRRDTIPGKNQCPHSMRVRARMNDSVLTLSIEVANKSNADIVICPSYVSIRRRGPHTMMFAGFGLGSSFDLEPSDQEPREWYIYEPAPATMSNIDAQFVILRAKQRCSFHYVYRHQQRKEAIDSGPWFVYGELGLPAWFRADSVAAPILNRIVYAAQRRNYYMNEEERDRKIRRVWWSIDRDTSISSLTNEERYVLQFQQVFGRSLKNPRVPVSMINGRL